MAKNENFDEHNKGKKATREWLGRDFLDVWVYDKLYLCVKRKVIHGFKAFIDRVNSILFYITM